MSMFVVRRATVRDIPYLHYLDICCYDNPWEEGTWLKRLYSSEVAVGTFMYRVIGFAVGTVGDHFVTVNRVAVHPRYRRLRLATKLLMPMVRLAIKQAKNLQMIIPETHLPEAGLWAKAEGFRPSAKPILPDYYTVCGDPVDGIAFTYEIQHAHKQAST